MKIKINEKEFHSIEMPNEITVDELNEILYRLNNISKMFSKDIMKISKDFASDNSSTNDSTKKITRKYNNSASTPNMKTILNTREKTIEVQKLFNFGSKSEIELFCDTYKVDREKMGIRLWAKRKLYHISSQEVGLKRYLNKNEGSGVTKADLKIPDFNYKFNSNMKFLE